ncbi:uncharacterized protein LACBIDRAFT_298864 [Laccaria bicolor S238N-H82]|uniref:Predicted protein n=1 Tax=Laccaria bicolor (strain S238N-H82 / ATCC MYA-4686) TaxID=486041 RepID=B0DE70_LACBS|nr:uncharacterized protein LACBIDRAFT_298864 [Laccaria bicolor S238N-H82]EDR07213.1 predicted protein [Laccaria bicolor S238N-H82]|eukprot:XP_001882144.1 predicted protein [Laccaria bicolor S238N-H82]
MFIEMQRTLTQPTFPPMAAGVCAGNPDQTYKGSTGWRRIPGNTCVDGVARDEKVDKESLQAT